MERNRHGPASGIMVRTGTRPDRMTLQHTQILRTSRHNPLRSLDFSSLHIAPGLLRSFSRRNTAAEAVAQAVVDTAEVVAPAVAAPAVAGREAVPEVALVAAPVAGREAVKAGVPAAAPAEARAAERAAPGAARQAASAGTVIRLIIRRGRLFHNFPRLRPPISK